VFLGDEIIHKGIFRDKKAMREKTAELLRRTHLDIDPRALAGSLPLPEQQLLEFAKAVGKNPKLLILDEATSALNTEQVALMFGILRELKKNGLAVLFISHRLKELFDLCDSMTVLKDGKQIVTEPIAGFDQNRLVSLMTGREIGGLFPPKDAARLAGSRELIKLSHVETRHLRDISFSVREGEILGIGGLAGQGQSYVLEALFGVEKIKRGTVLLRGAAVSFSSPLKAMENGIAYLPADRKTESLFLIHSIRFNMSIAHLDAISDMTGTVHTGLERAGNAAMCEKMQIKMRGQEQAAGELSGGNQQKAVVGKWLLREPSVLLLNEPTRGIDVGTKKQIDELLRALARQGITILLLSSDTLELVGLCDRVIVLYENQVKSEIDAEHLTEETLVSASVFKKGRQ
jgi:ABC-type sugar transport system ATPase subunit